MNNVNRWAVVVGMILVAAAVAFFAYNAGVESGIAQSGKIVTAPGGPYPYYGWHRPWGFGSILGPLIFIAFWLVLARGVFWRGACRRYGQLDEWHRRAHAHENAEK